MLIKRWLYIPNSAYSHILTHWNTRTLFCITETDRQFSITKLPTIIIVSWHLSGSDTNKITLYNIIWAQTHTWFQRNTLPHTPRPKLLCLCYNANLLKEPELCLDWKVTWLTSGFGEGAWIAGNRSSKPAVTSVLVKRLDILSVKTPGEALQRLL